MMDVDEMARRAFEVADAAVAIDEADRAYLDYLLSDGSDEKVGQLLQEAQKIAIKVYRQKLKTYRAATAGAGETPETHH